MDKRAIASARSSPLAPIGDALHIRDANKSAPGALDSTVTSSLRTDALERDHNIETWSKICDSEQADARDEGTASL